MTRPYSVAFKQKMVQRLTGKDALGFFLFSKKELWRAFQSYPMATAILAAIYLGIAWYAIQRARELRVALGFLLAPIAPALVATALDGHFLMLVVVLPFAYLFALLGVPVYFVFRRLGWLQIEKIVVASSALGGAVAFLGGFSLVSADGAVHNLANALRFVGFGALTGFAFWFIALSGRDSAGSGVAPGRG
jgi:hypothetical protein